MAYEREAISDSPAQQPNIAPTMREEKVVTPYSDTNRIKQAQERVTKSISGQNTPNEEVAATEPKAETTDSVTLTPQVAALARKEQKFRQEQQALKEREAKLAEKEAKFSKYAQLDEKLAAKDYSALEELAPYDEYTNYLIDKTTKLSPEAETIKKLEAKLDEVDKRQKDEVTKRFEAAVNERRKAVSDLVESNESFRQIKKANAQDAVVQHILDTWEHDDIDLSPEQAAKEVQEILLEKAQKWAELLEDGKDKAEKKDKTLPPLKSQIKTLTNNMTVTAETSKRPVKSYSQMNEAERYAEARRRALEKLEQGRQ